MTSYSRGALIGVTPKCRSITTHSVDKNTITRHIDIPPVFLQLKNSSNLNNSHRRTPAAKNPATMTTTHPATTNQIPQSTKETIRRSRRIQQQNEQREN